MNSSLFNFVRINLPYGIRLDKSGKWFAFNRGYKPIGWSTTDHVEYEAYPISNRFNGMTDDLLIKLGSSIRRDEVGKICSVVLYTDATNPEQGGVHWDNYAKKLKLLSRLRVSKQN